MKSYLVFCLLGLLHFPSAGANNLRPKLPTVIVVSDTIKMAGEGINNQIKLNARDITDSLAGIIQVDVKGEVVQRGESNWISLNFKEIESCTGRQKEVPDSMVPGVNHHSNDFSITNDSGNLIEIKQSGSNNRITINSK